MTSPAEGYHTLTTDDLARVHAERVHSLELDHARTVLLCREVIGTDGEAGPRGQLAEIERRIAVHVSPSKDEEEGGAHAAESDAPSTDDSSRDQVEQPFTFEGNEIVPVASNETVTTPTARVS